MGILGMAPRGRLVAASKTLQLRWLATKAGKQGKKGGAKKASTESTGPKYDHTINLPRTSFPMRASCSEREPQIQAERCVAGVYEWQKKNNTGSEFVLHDGPPFANGVPHVGHALNKVLKDMIVRYKVMRGHRVHYVPGWDCHGLPIEQKVLASVNRKELTPGDIRRRAREFALGAIDDQRKQFMRWGLLGDWQQPYITMDPKYEANQLGVFYKMYMKGIVYQAFKPVYWSPSSGTALAEAELEYADNHVSQSVFVKFPLQQLPPPLSTLGLPHVHAVIWTTTPWTLPANQAVAVNPNEKYVVASGPQVHCELPGSDLVGSLCAHPIHHQHTSKILPADFVTTDSGTGLVHMAPAHGQEDFGCCTSHGIGLGPSMVDDEGKFTEAAGKTLHGLEVLGQGQGKVVEALRHKHLLLGEAKYMHRYPYDWRSKQPVIVRATQQWFGRVGGDLRDAAERALQSVNMVPSVGRNRLIGTLETRDDWCLSRQRVWGVPIPVFYAQGTREPLINAHTIEHLQRLVAERGTDVWWEEETDNLLPEEYRGKGYQKREDGSQVADVYLEGSDQHRGWFQSSLLTSVAATGSAPFRTVICHGFVLDEQGRKMSKSIGNDAKKEPAMGADTLRLWVASTDYTSDVTIGTSILANTVEALRKLRNTTRFLLGNLDGFEYPAHAVATNEMLDVDRYILTTVQPLVDEVAQAYDSYNYSKVVRLLNTYVANELSAFYFELLKDRLYEEGRSSAVRRSAQTALFHLTDSLARLMAPIVPHLADDIWMHFPSHPLARQQSEDSKSIFQTGWVRVEEGWQCKATVERWTMARALRGHVNRIIEGARNDKTIRASLEATVNVYAPPQVYDMLKHIHGSEASSTTSQLTDLFGVSCATLHQFTSFPTHLPPSASLCTLETPDGQQHQVGLTLVASTLSKCPRCWKRAAQAQDTLCGRCEGRSSELHVAAAQGHTATVRRLLEGGSDVNTPRASDGATPLHMALQVGHHDTARALLSAGASVCAPRHDGQTPLHLAAGRGDQLGVALLLPHTATTSLPDAKGQTPLHIAAYHGHARIFEMLVRNGGDPNSCDHSGNAPLHVAASQGQAHMVEVIVDSGGVTARKNNKGQTPLHLAQVGGHAATTSLLQQHEKAGGRNWGGWGLRPSIRGLVAYGVGLSTSYLPPSMHPSQVMETVKRPVQWVGGVWVIPTDSLLDGPATVEGWAKNENSSRDGWEGSESGGDGEEKREEGTVEGLIRAAVWQGDGERVERLVGTERWRVDGREAAEWLHRAAATGNDRIIRALLRHGVPPDLRHSPGPTALHHTAARGHLLAAACLLEGGADVNVRDRTGRGALHAAAEGGHSVVVELLLRHGAQISLADQQGNTPLHLASINGLARTVELLIDNGSPQTQNAAGLTPRQCALRSPNPALASLFATTPAPTRRNPPPLVMIPAVLRRPLPPIIPVLLRTLLPHNPPFWLAGNPGALLLARLAFGSPHMPAPAVAMGWGLVAVICMAVMGGVVGFSLWVGAVGGLFVVGVMASVGSALSLLALVCFGPLIMLFVLVGAVKSHAK